MRRLVPSPGSHRPQKRGAADGLDVDGRGAVDQRIGGKPHHPDAKRDQDGDDGRQVCLLDRDEPPPAHPRRAATRRPAWE